MFDIPRHPTHTTPRAGQFSPSGRIGIPISYWNSYQSVYQSTGDIDIDADNDITSMAAGDITSSGGLSREPVGASVLAAGRNTNLSRDIDLSGSEFRYNTDYWTLIPVTCTP